VTNSPLEQFELHRLIPLHIAGFDVSYTNSALLMTLSVALSLSILLLGGAPRQMVPGRLQSLAEMFHDFIKSMVQDNCGDDGARFMPLVFSIFLFILSGNLLGLIPGSFTFTSHIIITFAMALAIFLMVTLLALWRHGLHFFSFFLPAGVPWWMWWLIIPIEIVSYLSRPISLSVRLFVNMFAGHMLMNIMSGFAIGLAIYFGSINIGLGAVAGAIPVLVNVLLTLFEVLVALLQAYVFAILTSLYIKDALELH
jgi:F-type H+-transporting ATPase subunit a